MHNHVWHTRLCVGGYARKARHNRKDLPTRTPSVIHRHKPPYPDLPHSHQSHDSGCPYRRSCFWFGPSRRTSEVTSDISHEKTAASSDSPNARAKRIALLARSTYVSHSGIENILKQLAEEGSPPSSSRRQLFRARKLLMNRASPYGPLTKLVELSLQRGGTTTIACQNPFAMLHYAAHHSEQYAALLRATLASNPCSPTRKWKLIV